jgi:hypothetical protein
MEYFELILSLLISLVFILVSSAFPIIFIGLTFLILRPYIIEDKKRKEAFQKFAQEKGLNYSGSHTISAIRGSGIFRLFNLGNGYGKQIENSVDGVIKNFQVSIFDYTYYETFSNKKLNKQTVAMVHSPHLNLPFFFIQPKRKGLFQNLRYNLIEPKNIDKEFSDKYTIASQDMQAIKSIFNHQVISYFKTMENFVVEGGGNCILFYRDGMMITPEQGQWMMQESVKIAQLFVSGRYCSA